MDESKLILLARQGDSKAFQELLQIYQRYIFKIILSFVKNVEESENLYQEVCIKIYRSIADYRSENFKGWISKIASNTALDYLRMKKSRPQEVSFEEWEEPQAPDSDSSHRMLAEERAQAIHALINQLPDHYREVIDLYYFKEVSREQIAIICGIPIRSVDTRIYRAKKILRKGWTDDASGEFEMILYIAGELSEKRQLEVENHLSGCEVCLSQYLELLEEIPDTIPDRSKALEPQEYPVREKERVAITPKSKISWGGQFASFVVAGFLIFFVSFQMTTNDLNRVQEIGDRVFMGFQSGVDEAAKKGTEFNQTVYNQITKR